LMRPSRSDIHPERIRPEAFPTAPTTRVMVARDAAAIPTLLAKGTSWLITIKPAEHPKAYPAHMSQNVGVRSISPGVQLSAAPAVWAGVGDQPSGRYPAGGFRSSSAPTVVMTRKI